MIFSKTQNSNGSLMMEQLSEASSSSSNVSSIEGHNHYQLTVPKKPFSKCASESR